MSVSIELYAHNSNSIYDFVNLKNHCRFTLKPATSFSLDEAFEVMRDVQNFLTLMVGEKVSVISMIGEQTVQHASLKGGRKETKEPFCCVFSQPDQSLPSRQNTRHMTMPMSRLGDKFVESFGRWFQSLSTLGPVYEVFFGLYRANRMYMQSRLLHLSQSVESYHRRVVGGTYLSEQEFEPIKHAVTNAIPPGISDALKAKLRSQIRYGNEPSLRKRLTAIMASLNDAERALVCDDVSEFVSCVVDTRNYLTHLDKDEDAKVLEEKALFDLTRGLETLITILLLKHLGISSDQVVQSVSECGRFGKFASA